MTIKRPFSHATLQYLNLFDTKVPFLHLLKMSENRSFSDIYRGYKNRKLVFHRLICGASRNLSDIFRGTVE